jgi:hypothetical protein
MVLSHQVQGRVIGFASFKKFRDSRRFRRNTSPPSSWPKNKSCKSFSLVSCSAYSSIMKMEATCSSETSVDFQRTARRSIPEGITPSESDVCLCYMPSSLCPEPLLRETVDLYLG